MKISEKNLTLKTKTNFSNTSTVIKACIDANVIISAVIFDGKPERVLKLAEEEKIRLVTSSAILSEVKKVLTIKFNRDDSEIKRVIKLLMNIGKVVDPKKKISKIAYGPDNRILECALEGEADYIVSGDKKHLLPLSEFEGIKIITASQILKIVRDS